MIGAENPFDSNPSTVRGDLSVSAKRSVVTASGDGSAAADILAVFSETEVVAWESATNKWVYE